MSTSYDLPESVTKDVLWIRHVLFSGNPSAGAPYVYGWIFKLERYTTGEERVWLREHGWGFSGGKWGKRDSEGN